VRFVVLHVTEKSELPTTEGIRVSGVGLGHVTRAVDLVVEHHQHTLAYGLLASRQGHRVIQIDGTISRDRGRGPHCADDDDGLSAFHDQIEKVRGLLDGVGPVGDDNSVDIVLREQLVDSLRELQPGIVVHVLAGDLEYLLAFDVGDLLQFRHCFDEARDAHGGGGIAYRGRACRTGTGDRAAGSEDRDVGEAWSPPQRDR
jgi:hypothetical protein